jgi:predicted alpha/beta superfamily hydrolase
MYPAIFGKMGIFSPSFWVAPGITGQISRLVKARKHSGQEYYFYGGGAENPSMIGDLQKVVELMYGFAGIKSTISINREGWHNEVCWKRAFQDFYSWIN